MEDYVLLLDEITPALFKWYLTIFIYGFTPAVDHFGESDSLTSAIYYIEGFLITHLCLVSSLAKVHSLSVVFFLGLSQASCMLQKTDAISAILLLRALISSPMLFSLIC